MPYGHLVFEHTVKVSVDSVIRDVTSHEYHGVTGHKVYLARDYDTKRHCGTRNLAIGRSRSSSW